MLRLDCHPTTKSQSVIVVRLNLIMGTSARMGMKLLKTHALFTKSPLLVVNVKKVRNIHHAINNTW